MLNSEMKHSFDRLMWVLSHCFQFIINKNFIKSQKFQVANLCQIFSSNVCSAEFDPFHLISRQYHPYRHPYDIYSVPSHFKINGDHDYFLLFTLSVGEQLDEFIFLNNFVGIRLPYHSLSTIAHDKPNPHAFFSLLLLQTSFFQHLLP